MRVNWGGASSSRNGNGSESLMDMKYKGDKNKWNHFVESYKIKLNQSEHASLLLEYIFETYPIDAVTNLEIIPATLNTD